MISDKHFHYEVGHVDQGVTVKVAHIPTHREKLVHLGPGETVADAQKNLKYELLTGFMDEKDFRSDIGRCKVDGKFGTFFRVVHIPTNRSQHMNSITSPGIKNHHELLLDMLIEELWREGILPKAVDTPDPCQVASEN